MDAATITAIGSAIAAVIGAVAIVVKIVVTRPRMPVAEELFEQIDELRRELLELAGWAHDARVLAAANGLELPPAPDIVRLEGRRHGEGREGRHGWRASVVAQTGELEAVAVDATAPLYDRRRGPETRPDRRAPRVPPP
jgi:hypothetical protein